MVLGALLSRVRGQTLQERLARTGFVGPGFDLIRLVAATTVLLHHCRGIDLNPREDALFAYSKSFFHFGLLAVLVFFAVSGFLVTPGLARSRNLIDFMTSRALRILPGLLTIVAVSMFVIGPAITMLPMRAYFLDPHLYMYTKNILTLTYDYLPGVRSSDGKPVIINGALWTLHFEILCYISLAALGVFGQLSRPRVVLMIFAGVYLLYIADEFVPSLTNFLPGRFVTFVSLFVYFAAGVTLYTYRDTVPYSSWLASIALAFMIVALPLGGGAIAAPLCLPYLVVFGGLSTLPGSMILKSDLSYGVYLIHAPVLVALVVVYPTLKPWWMVAAVVAVVTFPLSYLSWVFVERPTLVRKKATANWIRALLLGPQRDRTTVFPAPHVAGESEFVSAARGWAGSTGNPPARKP